jgi:hypothetical protein
VCLEPIDDNMARVAWYLYEANMKREFVGIDEANASSTTTSFRVILYDNTRIYD